MTDERLQQIREREAKATPGPWVTEDCDCGSVWWGMDPDMSEIRVCDCQSTDPRQRNLPNAHFIANSRLDIPDLLAYVDELRLINKGLELILTDPNALHIHLLRERVLSKNQLRHLLGDDC